MTIDIRRLIERWKKGNQIEKLPLYLEKLLKLSILKSSVGQSYNVLKKGASKRFILPTMLNSLMKVLALRNPHTLRKEIAISSKLWLCRDWLQHILRIQLFLLFTIEFPKEEARWKLSLLVPIRFSYSSKISSNCVNVALPYICYWLRQFHLQPQNSVLSWLRQFYLQPQSSALSSLRLVS